jgi:phenylpropionate dioxygenase-like ring-hydroxylating dioxygenase large terminal subunit
VVKTYTQGSKVADTAHQVDYDHLIDMRQGRLHGSVYTDRAVLEDEFDRIWHRGWVYAGHDSEVAEPGDYVLRLIGREPILITRRGDGSLSVLINLCPSGGHQVANDERGNASTFQCPFHPWTFDNEGVLLDGPYSEGHGADASDSQVRLAKVPRVELYRGFVFVSLAAAGLSLLDHLGSNGRNLIDRCCDAAPDGEIIVKAGVLQHRMHCNWKMIVENDTDGYHPPFVHAALFKAHAARPGSRLSGRGTARTTAAGSKSEQGAEKATPARSGGVVRDWQNGHAELDGRVAARSSGRLFEWLPGADQSKLGWWVEAVERRVGPDRARKILAEGPPHATIFPNLFLGRLNIITIQPLDVDDTIQYTAPIALKGAPEFEAAILIHTQGGLGPAGLLFADDDEIAERNQLGLQASSPEWLYLARGLERELVDETEGDSIVSDSSDETSQRALWKRYLEVMRAVPAAV